MFEEINFLKQAATDIITILTRSPSTTTPSLQAGDPVRNALLELATQLNRIDVISEPSKVDTSILRVLPLVLNKHSDKHTQLPRVEYPDHNPTTGSTLQIRSK